MSSWAAEEQDINHPASHPFDIQKLRGTMFEGDIEDLLGLTLQNKEGDLISPQQLLNYLVPAPLAFTSPESQLPAPYIQAVKHVMNNALLCECLQDFGQFSGVSQAASRILCQSIGSPLPEPLTGEAREEYNDREELRKKYWDKSRGRTIQVIPHNFLDSSLGEEATFVLPFDVFQHIISFLPPFDIGSVALSSRFFCRLTRGEVIYPTLRNHLLKRSLALETKVFPSLIKDIECAEYFAWSGTAKLTQTNHEQIPLLRYVIARFGANEEIFENRFRDAIRLFEANGYLITSDCMLKWEGKTHFTLPYSQKDKRYLAELWDGINILWHGSNIQYS